MFLNQMGKAAWQAMKQGLTEDVKSLATKAAEKVKALADNQYVKMAKEDIDRITKNKYVQQARKDAAEILHEASEIINPKENKED